ncbi:hypothetical protein C8R45DRAFT_519234 [Mycena sanguinolenta]|nr:hypothetical protein C8R45DRAFT_519234 [Mycena sanguinolenta]
MEGILRDQRIHWGKLAFFPWNLGQRQWLSALQSLCSVPTVARVQLGLEDWVQDGTQITPAGRLFQSALDLTVNAFDASFLKVLSHVELPWLRTVAFGATAVGGGAEFFQKHGAKLQKATLSSLQLDNPALAIRRSCPYLTVLALSCGIKHPPERVLHRNI